MKQVLVIHGGTSFSSYDAYRKALEKKQINYEKITHSLRWKERLSDQLTDWDVLYPTMPNSANAVFDEWKIFFEKLIPFFSDDIQIIGHSLGVMFLAKYLQEYPLATPVKRLLLVAGGYNDETYEDLGSFMITSASDLPTSASEIHLFHSTDDPVVPFGELAKFQADLPNAISHVFTDRGHFLQQEFPELFEIIKK
ncbi:alpha/beta hydrolase [Candidatus Saccharibacteria bacterium]|nr:alpha/beta hydrolase [Candidatus Saccharibacteria bacterium]